MGTVLACVAVLFRRLDLLVPAVPLLGWVVLATAARPTRATDVSVDVPDSVVVEGRVVPLTVDLHHDPRADAAAVTWAGPARIEARPTPSRHDALDGSSSHRVELRLRPTVWGSYRLGEIDVRLTDAWGAYSSRTTLRPPGLLTVLPSPRPLAGVPDRLDPAGLLGRHLSARPGEGSEFAEVRPYRPGDRMRRIHWPTTARRGDLHVRTHHAEQDGVVIVLVDALDVFPGPTPDAPTSLETAVRAAAQLAAHFVRGGDRVGLRVVDDRTRPVPAASGRRHLRRILGVLAQVEPSPERTADPPRLHLDLPAGSLVVAVTPLVSRRVVEALAVCQAAGATTAVLDVMPDVTSTGGTHVRLAWRMLRLEAATTADRLRRRGVVVAPWSDATGVEPLLHGMDRRRRAVRR